MTSTRPDPRSGLDGDGRWTPAFEGQRPPFQPDHVLSLRHGAYAVVHLAPRASEIADALRPVVPGYSPADEPSVGLLAVTLARVERATSALEKVDEATGERELAAYMGDNAPTLQRLREDLRGWINTARRLANDLGMTPTSRAKLGLNVALGQDAAQRALERHLRTEHDGRADHGASE